MSSAEDAADMVSKAMRRSWQLGQTYWQQADSESYAANKRSEATQAMFTALVDEVRAALAQPAASGEPAPAPAPLTDEQINDCMPVGMAPYVTLCGPVEIRQFARAIEAAHGITAKTQSGRDWSLLAATQESLREHMAEIASLRVALAAERERCAVLVEDTQRQWPGEGLDGWLLAAQIRAAA